MTKYIIEKDPYLNIWILWQPYYFSFIDIYHGKTKKECEKKLCEINLKK
jgi:hypothetical protein